MRNQRCTLKKMMTGSSGSVKDSMWLVVQKSANIWIFELKMG